MDRQQGEREHWASLTLLDTLLPIRSHLLIGPLPGDQAFKSMSLLGPFLLRPPQKEKENVLFVDYILGYIYCTQRIYTVLYNINAFVLFTQPNLVQCLYLHDLCLPARATTYLLSIAFKIAP